jgi:hypothetical protein
MKRVLAVTALAATTVLISAGSALAGDYGPGVSGGGGVRGAGGTAFTGGDVATGVIVAVALVAVGLAALFVARRSAAKSVA